MKAALLTLVVVTGSAAAQTVPGTGGDMAREMLIEPSFVNSELPIGLPMRGGNPEDTVVLFDGFELPGLFHGDGIRSVLPFASIESIEILPGAFGVEYGRGSSIVALSSQRAQRLTFDELTVVDLSAQSGLAIPGFLLTARWGTDRLVDKFRDGESGVFGDIVGRYDRRLTDRWTLSLSGIYSIERAREFSRTVAAAQFKSRGWQATFAASPLWQQDLEAGRFTIDTRAEIVRRADAAAGLTKLEWRLGQQTNSARETIDDARSWHTDVGAWSSIAANLSSAIRATAGVRIDNFDGDVATQPRAQLVADVASHVKLALGAGAYRRPPNQRAELAVPSLHPERATHVVAAGAYDDGGLRIRGAAYYIDRRRLIVPDSDGVLRNSGFGTSLGAELSAELRDGPWRASLSGALTSSQRFDYLRARAHAAPFEQPVRLDALAAWSSPRWILSARFQLYSGLPYTPYTDSLYNSDTDSYEPLYVPPLSARAPLHHQVDLRIDYRFATKRVGFDAFLDLHNAYGNRDALEYRYSYDYRDRTAISALPIFPFAGLRVAL